VRSATEEGIGDKYLRVTCIGFMIVWEDNPAIENHCRMSTGRPANQRCSNHRPVHTQQEVSASQVH
jgi:hypothetical protein